MNEHNLPPLDPQKESWDEEPISRRRFLELGFWAATGTASVMALTTLCSMRLVPTWAATFTGKKRQVNLPVPATMAPLCDQVKCWVAPPSPLRRLQTKIENGLSLALV
jgi:hypothetical protein